MGLMIGEVMQGVKGLIGMNVQVRENVRKEKEEYMRIEGGMEMDLKYGEIKGIMVDGMEMIGVQVYYLVMKVWMGYEKEERKVIEQIVQIGFGDQMI